MRAHSGFLLFAIGLLVGGVATRYIFVNDRVDRSVAAELDAVAHELRALALAHQTTTTVPVPRQDDVVAVRAKESSDSMSSSSTPEELRGLIQRLEAIFGQVADRSEDLTLTREPIPQNRTAVAALRQDVSASQDNVTGRHFCWSRVQVYRAYGMPDGVIRSGQSITWEYFPDSTREGVVFDFEDGLVTRVYPWQSPVMTPPTIRRDG